jgi:hypothetical protein
MNRTPEGLQPTTHTVPAIALLPSHTREVASPEHDLGGHTPKLTPAAAAAVSAYTGMGFNDRASAAALRRSQTVEAPLSPGTLGRGIPPDALALLLAVRSAHRNSK